VTDVVRGEDLLPSAALQQRMAKLLGGTAPDWWHLPLVLDASGRRLAKRDGDQTLESFRARMIPPERIIGLLARSSGLQDALRPMSRSDLVDSIELDVLASRAREESADGGYQVTHEDLEWLEKSSS
jgi:glutamyl-tRNA synthetase